MNNTPTLGFVIDTATLDRARLSATQLRQALEGLAGAHDRNEVSARRSLDAQRQSSLEAQRLAQVEAEVARRKDIVSTAGARAAGVMAGLQTSAAGLQGALGGLSQSMLSTAGVIMVIDTLSASMQALLPLMGTIGMIALPIGIGLAAIGSAFVGLSAMAGGAEERMVLLEARLKNVYENAQLTERALVGVIGLSQENGVALAQASDAFLRLSRNNEAIGLTTDQMLDLTDAVQKLGRISNASSGELASGLLQFSQALAAGRLNGDELRSIMENMPALAKAIADGMEVSVGQMRALGAEGRLTSDKITEAILSQLPKIRQEFENLPNTADVAFTRVANSWELLLAEMGERLNSMEFVVSIATKTDDALQFLTGIVGAGSASPLRVAERTIANARMTDDDIRSRAADSELSLFPDWMNRAILRDVRRDAQVTIATPEFQAEYARERGLYEAEQMHRMARTGQEAEARIANRAPFVRSAGTVQELQKNEGKVKETEGRIKLLQTVVDGLAARPQDFEPQERERIETIYPRLIAALNTQLGRMVPVLDDYLEETGRQNAYLQIYGAGGAASMGEAIDKLVQSSAAKGEDVSFDRARAAVTGRRINDVRTRTAGFEDDIARALATAEANRTGAAAQREAEVAAERHNLQLRLFGTTVGPEVSDFLDRFADKLRELKIAQEQATAAQREFNAALDLADENVILEALRNGATPGDIAALRRQQGLDRRLDGVAPPVGTPADMLPMFEAASQASGVPTALLVAMARQESGFDPNAVSATGALGVMQILPSTARDPGYGVAPTDVAGLADPATNIMFGAQYLAGRGRALGVDWADETDVRRVLRAYGGADQPLGDPNYDSNVLRYAGSDYRAVLAEAEVGDVRAAQGAAERIATLEREIANLQARQRAPDAVARREVEIRQQAEKAAESVEPQERGAVVAAEIARLRAEDVAAQEQQVEALERALRVEEDRLGVAGLTPKQRERELEVLRMIRQEEEAGRRVTAEREAEIRGLVEARFDAASLADDAAQAADRFETVWNSAADSVGSSLESAIRTGVERGALDASKLATGLLADIASAIARAYMINPLVSGLKGIIGAHGLAFGDGGARVFAHGGVVPEPTLFAAGGLVSEPTLFAYGGGTGLMGEAGPEAILPLSRGPDGKLGVQTTGSGGSGSGPGVTVVVNDMRGGNDTEAVEVSEGRGPDGQRVIEILVRDEVRRQVQSGGLDREMRTNFGVTRQLTRR